MEYGKCIVVSAVVGLVSGVVFGQTEPPATKVIRDVPGGSISTVVQSDRRFLAVKKVAAALRWSSSMATRRRTLCRPGSWHSGRQTGGRARTCRRGGWPPPPQDRFLLSIGEPQWYGTQYRRIDGTWELSPIDPTQVTDEPHRASDVPTLAGLVLLVNSYRIARSRAGIPVASLGFALFCDAVLLAWGLCAVAVSLDAAWVTWLGQPSLVGLEPEWPSDQVFTAGHFVALPALLVALPLLTLVFTSLANQRVQVDGDGVTASRAVGSSGIRRDELERVMLGDQRNPAAVTVSDLRRLQRVLVLEGGERRVTVNEPTSRARKRRIVEALRSHAPESKRGLLEQLGRW